MIPYPLPTAPTTAPTTAQAALKLWTIRQLQREGGIDAKAAETSLEALRDHPNPNVSRAAGKAAS